MSHEGTFGQHERGMHPTNANLAPTAGVVHLAQGTIPVRMTPVTGGTSRATPPTHMGYTSSPAGGSGTAGMSTIGGAGGGIRNAAKDDPEWLTNLLRLLWPQIAPAVEKEVWKMLPDMMNKAKPAWITTLGLRKFKLGDDAPKILNIKAMEGTDPAVPDIYLEADVDWKTDKTDIEFDINPLPTFVTKIPGLKNITTIMAGVEDLSFTARLHISMTPLLNEIPVVGAIQLSFIDEPDVNFNLTMSHGADPLLNAFEPWLMSFIEDYITNNYTYPGHIFTPLKEGIPDILSATGVLEVEILEAEGVPKMDYFQNSSPYCKVWLTGASKETKQTPTVDYTKNPVWRHDNSFGFAVHSVEHQQMVLALFDSDVGGDDQIGRIHFHINKLQPGRPEDMWLSFIGEEGDEEQGQQQQQGKKKRSMFQKLTMALMPTANQLDKQLPKCRVHVRASYHPIPVDDVKRLHEAEVQQQGDVEGSADLIQDHTIRQLVQRYNLYNQLASAKTNPPADKSKDQTKDATKDTTTTTTSCRDQTTRGVAPAAGAGATGTYGGGAYGTGKPGMAMADYPAGPAAGDSTYAPATGAGVGAGFGAAREEKFEAPSASRAAAATLGALNLS